MTPPSRVPLPVARARATIDTTSAPPSIASSRAAGSSSARRSRRSKPSSRAAMGAAHAVGVGTGTDAIALILRALGIGPGDEVITDAAVGGVHRARDHDGRRAPGVRRHRSGSPDDRSRTQVARAIGPRTRAILPVHLYGQPADMAAIERIAARHQLAIVEDCCQAHLATAAGRPVGNDRRRGRVQLLPDQESRRARRRRRGRHQRSARWRHASSACGTAARPTAIIIRKPGVNSRLDEMQAAILRARLPRLGGWTERRRVLAARYRQL